MDEPFDYPGRLEADCARIAGLLATADLEAPVGSCPPWRLRDLAVHHGQVLYWAAGVVRTGGRHAAGAAPPATDPELAPWYRRGYLELLDLLGQVPAAAPCWTLFPPATVSFWHRRQALEAVIHRWDAESAVGLVPVLDAELAADGIDEVLTGQIPRQLRLGRLAALPASVSLVSGPRSWTLPADGGTVPAGRVCGTAADLLLLLWKRVPLDERFEVAGDRAATEGLLGLALTP